MAAPRDVAPSVFEAHPPLADEVIGPSSVIDSHVQRGVRTEACHFGGEPYGRPREVEPVLVVRAGHQFNFRSTEGQTAKDAGLVAYNSMINLPNSVIYGKDTRSKDMEPFLASLEAAGRTVRRWPGLHHYFGGVSAIGRAGAAADPRRSGAVVTV